VFVLEIPYKSLGERSLALHVLPASTRPGGPVPAPTAVFYHGGGWVKGSWRQFLPQAERLSELGMASVLVEYRLDGPVDATADAVDAMNAVVELAGDIDADPGRIVAIGGSAGGHLALATAVLDLPSSRPGRRPAALALLNPVTDTTAAFPAGFGREAFDTDEQAERYSPRHHVTAAFPPALIMHGTADGAVHHQNSVAFAEEVRRRGGGPAELILYPGQRHGFFNPDSPDRAGDAYFERTTAELTRFLRRTVLRTAWD
jgi:acetyl esterase